MKRKIIILIIYLTGSFLYQRTNPGWVTSWGIDPATYLFFTIAPLLWFLRVGSTKNAVIAIIFLALMAITYMLKQEQTAENMAIMAFFFLVTSVLQSIVELRRQAKNYED